MGKEVSEFLTACRTGDCEKVESILTSKSKRPRTPIGFFRGGHQWASCRDAVSGYSGAHLAALSGSTAVLNLLLKHDASLATATDRRDCRPLHLAAWAGHAPAVQLLLEYEPAGSDAANSARDTPLHLAAQGGHCAVVDQLLKGEADATLRNARGETPLDGAARLGRTGAVELLLRRRPALALDAAVDVGGCFPLHAAARGGHADAVAALLDGGVSMDHVTEQGSALHVAALFGKTPIVRCLLSRGIDTSICDWQGRTVLDVLAEHEDGRSSDITQHMQNRAAWSECRKLIEGRILSSQKGDRGGGVSSPVLSESAYLNITAPPAIYENPNPHSDELSPVWQKLPIAVAEKAKRDDSGLATSPTGSPSEVDGALGTVLGDNVVCQPECRSSSTDCQSAETSLASVSHSPPQPSMSVQVTDLTCGYGAPTGYDAWQPAAVDAVATDQPHPHLSYDNVPSNLLAYDNAPPSPHRRWHHACTCPQSPADRTGSCRIDVRDDRTVVVVSASNSGSLSPAERPVLPPRRPRLAHSSHTPPLPCREMGACGGAPLVRPEDVWGSTASADALSVAAEEPSPPSAAQTESLIFSAVSRCRPLPSPSFSEKESQIGSGVCAQERRGVGMREASGDSSPLNESAEWAKIDGIMASFGGGICRESVFAENLEPRVAVYLRNRCSGVAAGASSDVESEVAEWLQHHVQIDDWRAVAARLQAAGFNRLRCLRDALTDDVLSDVVGVSAARDRQRIVTAAARLPPLQPIGAHSFVSDWLNALDCDEFLGAFMRVGLDSIERVRRARLDGAALEQMGVTSVGAVRRIVVSLQEAPTGETDDAHVSDYSAHYLGSVELAEPTDAAATRHAIAKLKVAPAERVAPTMRGRIQKAVREIHKVPQVVIEISWRGVRVMDAHTQRLVADTRIDRIHGVSQDRRDLNCFAFTAEDHSKHFCHVFSVLTADLATEIILAFGRAFEVAFQMAVGEIQV